MTWRDRGQEEKGTTEDEMAGWHHCLGREDPLEKEMATHSSILAWRTPWTEEPGRLQSMGLQEFTCPGSCASEQGMQWEGKAARLSPERPPRMTGFSRINLPTTRFRPQSIAGLVTVHGQSILFVRR